MSLLCLSAESKNLLPNGSFENKEYPLQGWIRDYEFSGNKHYVDNYERVVPTASHKGRRNVVELKKDDVEAGTKIECEPLPFKVGDRYSGSVYVTDGDFRVYFAGYKWKPGIRPHDNPKMSELRMVYRGKAESGKIKAWKKLSVEIPGQNISDAAKKHLSQVRFVTFYVWAKKGGFVDEASVVKVR